MTRDEAARLLGVLTQDRPEAIDTRYYELRASLEDKLAKAPSQGIKDKLRQSISEVDKAHEILVTTAGEVSNRLLEQRPAAEPGRTTSAVAPAGVPEEVAAAPIAAAPRRPVSPWLLMVITAVVVAGLGAGAWGRWKHRLKVNEEARLAAEARAEQEREQAAGARERERRTKLASQVTAQLAEARQLADVVRRELDDTARAIEDLKGPRRGEGGEEAEASSLAGGQILARTVYLEWLRRFAEVTPALRTRQQVEGFLAAGQVDEAAQAAGSLAAQVEAARAGLATARPWFLDETAVQHSWTFLDGILTEVAPGDADRVRTWLVEAFNRATETDDPQLTAFFARNPEKNHPVPTLAELPVGEETLARAKAAGMPVLIGLFGASIQAEGGVQASQTHFFNDAAWSQAVSRDSAAWRGGAGSTYMPEDENDLLDLVVLAVGPPAKR